MSDRHGNMPMSPNYINQTNIYYMDNMAMMMHMSFYWGKDVVVLFAGWPGGSGGMYILALAVVFLLAVAAEFLSAAPSLKPRGLSRPMAGAVLNAAVYGVRVALAYMIMLSVMSFNVGVFAAAVCGHAVGRFIAKYRELSAVAPAAADY